MNKITRRFFLGALPAIGAGIAAIPHLVRRRFAYRQMFVPTELFDDNDQPITSGAVEFTDVQLQRSGTLDGRRVQVVLANRWGVPLAYSDLVDPAFISTAPMWVRFVFRKPATVHVGTRYSIDIFERDASRA